MRHYRLIALLILIVLPSIACATGSLWGDYDGTPTSEIPPVVLTLRAATATLPVSPTAIEITPLPQDTATPETLPTVDIPVTVTATEAGTLGGGTSDPLISYYSQSGDTIPAVAAHFWVKPEEIIAPAGTSPTGILDPGTLLRIPNHLPQELSQNVLIMPDSEVVYSPSAVDFDIKAYLEEQGGYLLSYRQWLGSTNWTTGTEAVERISFNNSLNPRLILSLIEYQSHWVTGQPTNLAETDYPLGNHDYYYNGLYRQLMWASEVLAEGYYGWRAGTLTELTFEDGSTLALSPGLNAGSVAVMHMLSQTMNRDEWAQAVDPNIGFPAWHAQMFGDPWLRAAQVEPLLPAGLTQPEMVLPFPPNQTWYYTGGPHPPWEKRGPLAAIDFAPQADKAGCVTTPLWATAAAPGLVVRSDYGVVMVDLDWDGYEQTGWNLLYLHMATDGRAALGARLETDDLIGHPSCEGGISTGTHLHFARKYNGEWILADGGLPFTLSGWRVKNGDRPYYGGLLIKGDQVVKACPCGDADTKILRFDD